ncbi:MAG: hypothetical protein MK183_14820 [Verrucomicrobiales bacterium]|nr:hypothetical protein [Verrucomicrobiales bacterium]MED5585379.1 hypothetical protein [Verrucomicrobiota bacterium]
MSRLLILLLPVFGLVFSVPWFFSGDSGERFLGFPSWVVYALLAAAAYALVVAVLIGRFWDVSAGSQEDDE